LQPGVAFPHRHPHELAHVRPLVQRLQDVLVAPPGRATVVVQADTRPPQRGAWNVQVFHGLGDKGYTSNPLFLQRRRFPRVRTAFNRPLAALHLPAPFLRAPHKPGRRASRYEQVNAYGPRWVDLLESFLKDAEVSRFGHVALNESDGIERDADGPLVWLPTWDNRAYLGGAQQSSLETFAKAVADLAQTIPVLVKYHPLTVEHNQAKRARRLLESAGGVTVAPADAEPYGLLHGARGLLTDTSSVGFEAFGCNLPVALAKNPGLKMAGLHEELEARVPAFAPVEGTALRAWAESPSGPGDAAWARDLLFEPARRRNDAFAAALRQRAVERALG
jgi:hypothetical protein